MPTKNQQGSTVPDVVRSLEELEAAGFDTTNIRRALAQKIDGTSEFTPPRTVRELGAALIRAEREYETARIAISDASWAHQTNEDSADVVKRDLIKGLVDRGIAVTRAEKEYTNEPAWHDVLKLVRETQKAKLDADCARSIAGRRLSTLTALAAFAQDDANLASFVEDAWAE